MKKLDENTALSILFANTRRKKRTVDLTTLARSCQFLVDEYGSMGAVAEKTGFSTEMIREFLAVLKLPREVQKVVSKREIDSLDVVREILALKDSDMQITAAQTLKGSSSEDVRDVKRLVKYGNLTVKEAKRVISDAKPKGLHVFIMDFDDETYQAIVRQAKTLKVDPAELVKGIVEDWLGRKPKVTKERRGRE